jgi:hypothetical protein
MKIQHSHGKNYKVSESGTFYNEATDNKVIEILEAALKTKERLQIFLGDIASGANWNEENDTIGTIGRSNGEIKIPLLIKTKRSYGGGGILTDCIIAIKINKKVVYQISNLKPQTFEITSNEDTEYPFSLIIDGEVYSNHKTELSAKRLQKKLTI